MTSIDLPATSSHRGDRTRASLPRGCPTPRNELAHRLGQGNVCETIGYYAEDVWKEPRLTRRARDRNASLSSVDPTVTAAAIGVGGTVLVGVAGFGAAIWNTKQTIGHDREARVWDRRADAYVETLTAIHNRQVRRGLGMGTRPMDHRLRAGMQALAGKYQMDAAGLEARLQAFGSERVFSAVQTSSTADRDAVAAYDSWRTAVGALGASPKDQEKARRAADAARKAADEADDAVIEQIRRELHGNGKPLGDWEYFPQPTAPADEEKHQNDPSG